MESTLCSHHSGILESLLHFQSSFGQNATKSLPLLFFFFFFYLMLFIYKLDSCLYYAENFNVCNIEGLVTCIKLVLLHLHNEYKFYIKSCTLLKRDVLLLFKRWSYLLFASWTIKFAQKSHRLALQEHGSLFLIIKVNKNGNWNFLIPQFWLFFILSLYVTIQIFFRARYKLTIVTKSSN